MGKMTRRQFGGRMAAGATAVGVQSLIPTGPTAANPLNMDIGLQLNWVDAALERDFEGALKTVAAIGYRQVEIKLSSGRRKAKQLRNAFQTAGLGWKSAHTSVAELHANLDQIIEEANQAGVRYLICATPWVADPSRLKPVDQSDPLYKVFGEVTPFVALLSSLTLDDWKWNADFLNEAGRKTKAAGIQVGYHNHFFEFKKINGTLAYDELLRLTDPDLVKFELDCGWMINNGYDPVTYLEKYPTRYCLLHIKDLKSDTVQGAMIHTTEVGSGTIDWKKIFAAARRTQVAGYYVEQEPPYVRPELESARISYNYLRGLTV